MEPSDVTGDQQEVMRSTQAEGGLSGSSFGSRGQQDGQSRSSVDYIGQQDGQSRSSYFSRGQQDGQSRSSYFSRGQQDVQSRWSYGPRGQQDGQSRSPYGSRGRSWQSSEYRGQQDGQSWRSSEYRGRQDGQSWPSSEYRGRQDSQSRSTGGFRGQRDGHSWRSFGSRDLQNGHSRSSIGPRGQQDGQSRPSFDSRDHREDPSRLNDSSSQQEVESRPSFHTGSNNNLAASAQANGPTEKITIVSWNIAGLISDPPQPFMAQFLGVGDNDDEDDEDDDDDDDDDEDEDEEDEDDSDDSDDEYDDDLTLRTEGACQILLRQNPDVILLQEVVDYSLDILRREMTNYEIIVGSGEHIGITAIYYTAILVNKNTVEVHTPGVVLFPTTRMKRNLLYFKGRVRGVPMTVMTSHMESQLPCSDERRNQIRIAFREMTNTGPDETVVFGGDLNVRDWEIGGDTAIPPGVLDLWEATGSRPDTQYTWDLRFNDSLRMPGRNSPRKRFDRMYIRHSSPPAVETSYFRFIGTLRLPSCQRFASDHWGLLASFRVLRHGSAGPWRGLHDGGQASSRGQQEDSCQTSSRGQEESGQASSRSPQDDGQANSLGQQEDSGQASSRDRQEISQTRTFLISIGDQEVLDQPETQGSDNSGLAARNETSEIQEKEGDIKIVSWNIAGLETLRMTHSSHVERDDKDKDEEEDDEKEEKEEKEDDLTLRTKGACQILLQNNPDVIMLQEVKDHSLEILRSEMTNYEIFAANGEVLGITAPSYCAILINMDTVEVHSSGVILYPGSRMRRNLLYLKGRVRGVLMTLMTSHLESSAQNYIERGKQLAKVYKEMAEVEPDQTVLFGGDLNVHDWEMGGGTPIPPGVLDLWEVTGRRPETRFTWDLTINDNMQYPEGNQPRKRFDRMYIRHSSTQTVEPLNFRFIGTDRLPSCHRFISDHWGLLASFRVKQHGSAVPRS